MRARTAGSMPGSTIPAEPAGWVRPADAPPMAPPAAEQPAPVPHRPRPDGSPWATPLARARARELGIPLPHRETGRIRLADLVGPDGVAPPPSTTPTAGTATAPTADSAPSPAEVSGPAATGSPAPATMAVTAAAWAGLTVAGVEADVTALMAAVPPDLLPAVLARAAARGLVAHDGLLPGRDPVLRVEGPDHPVDLRQAHHLTLTGVVRALADGGHAGPATLVLACAPPDGPLWTARPPLDGAAATLTAGAVRREVRVVAHEGTEAVAVRSVLRLTLVHDDRVRPAEAGRFLSHLRAALADPAVAAPPGERP